MPGVCGGLTSSATADRPDGAWHHNDESMGGVSSFVSGTNAHAVVESTRTIISCQGIEHRAQPRQSTTECRLRGGTPPQVQPTPPFEESTRHDPTMVCARSATICVRSMETLVLRRGRRQVHQGRHEWAYMPRTPCPWHLLLFHD